MLGVRNSSCDDEPKNPQHSRRTRNHHSFNILKPSNHLQVLSSISRGQQFFLFLLTLKTKKAILTKPNKRGMVYLLIKGNQHPMYKEHLNFQEVHHQ
jgi:hypothetical protein